MLIKSIESKQELENALKRINELRNIAEPNVSEVDELNALASSIEAHEADLINNEKLEFDNIFEAINNNKVEAKRLKNISDELIRQREILDINDIEFRRLFFHEL